VKFGKLGLKGFWAIVQVIIAGKGLMEEVFESPCEILENFVKL
jgi:hypothetical protein